MVKDGSFRQDLFYRLNIFPIKIPPLRERKQDIVELSQHFIESCSKRTFKKIEKIEDSFLSILKAYSWPGNVRELENIIERAMIFAQDGILRAEDVQILNKPENISQNLEAQLNSDGSPLSLTEMLERFEKKLIQNAIRNCDGNKSKAARSLGLKPNVLHYKLEKYEILNPS